MARIDDLAAALGVPASDPLAVASLAAAEDLVTAFLAGGPATPARIVDLAVVEVAAGLARRNDSLSGSAQYVDPATPVSTRGPRDPLATVRPMLAPYTTPGIA